MDTPDDKARLLRDAILKKFPESVHLYNSMCVIPWYKYKTFLIYSPITNGYCNYIEPNVTKFFKKYLENIDMYIDTTKKGFVVKGFYLPDGYLEDDKFEALIGLILMYGGKQDD